jgi:hypothetical protein
MEKKYKVVNLPKEPTRHYLGNFGLVEIKENLPSEICKAGFDAGLPYFAEVPISETPVIEAAQVAELEEVKEEKKLTKK